MPLRKVPDPDYLWTITSTGNSASVWRKTQPNRPGNNSCSAMERLVFPRGFPEDLFPSGSEAEEEVHCQAHHQCRTDSGHVVEHGVGNARFHRHPGHAHQRLGHEGRVHAHYAPVHEAEMQGPVLSGGSPQQDGDHTRQEGQAADHRRPVKDAPGAEQAVHRKGRAQHHQHGQAVDPADTPVDGRSLGQDQDHRAAEHGYHGDDEVNQSGPAGNEILEVHGYVWLKEV